MRIAVFEFLCSSGAYTDDGPCGPYSPLLDEGAAMLLSLASDLAACGHQVTIALEKSIEKQWTSQSYKSAAMQSFHIEQIAHLNDPSCEVIAQRWAHIAADCDWSIVIAPELDHLLWKIIRSMREKGCRILAPHDEFIRCASDKWETFQRWEKNRLSTIATWLAKDWVMDPDRFDSNDLPTDGWVLKRRLTAGGTDLQRYSSKRKLCDAITQLQSPSDWIVQPWVLGIAASLAIVGENINRPDQSTVIGPCQQLFDPDTGCYIGGLGPLPIAMPRLISFAGSLLNVIPHSTETLETTIENGTKGTGANQTVEETIIRQAIDGWVGIDFLMLPDDRWIPLEINSRLTSSYLGYRKHFGPQIANSILGQPLAAHPEIDPANPDVFRFSVNDFHG